MYSISLVPILWIGLFSFIIIDQDKNQFPNNFDHRISEQFFNTDTIFIDKPTGEFEKDRQLIISKLDLAKPGDIIKFSKGTYYIGKLIKIEIPELALIGNEEGTIIRGCQPDNFNEHINALLNCGGFELTAESQTVRNFIFEYAWHGLMIGCCLPKDRDEVESGDNLKLNHPGGHLIENNTFRYNSTGIRVFGINSKNVKIINNVFIDNYHGLTINGSNNKVKNNKFYSKNPEKVPLDKKSDNAIGITLFFDGLPPHLMSKDENDCSNNIIENNYIENFKTSIRINGKKPEEIAPDDACSNNIIKENTIKN